MSFSSAQRSCHELLHWFVTKSVRAIFLSYRRKMFQRVGSRAFLHTTSALKMTIPDLVRMCKRDILPLENVSKAKAQFFLHRSLQDTHSSKGRIPLLIKERGIATNAFSLRSLPHVDTFLRNENFTLYKPLEQKKTPTAECQYLVINQLRLSTPNRVKSTPCVSKNHLVAA